MTQAEVAVYVRRTGPDARGGARRLLVAAAAELAGVAEAEIRVEYEPGGRPFLAGAGRGLSVSVSHGQGLAAVALTRAGRVGVDLEVLRPVRAERLAERWFSAAETAWVSARPPEEQQEAFFWLWTRKEAVGKALGIGLRESGTRRPVGLPVDGCSGPGDRMVAVRGGDGAVQGCFAMPGLPYENPRVLLAVAGVGGELEGAGVVLRIAEEVREHRAAAVRPLREDTAAVGRPVLSGSD
ncbi:4'-phosphopantetheinyl transferase superfamily protein [Kitasatospora sp. NBC_01560]|uniref:4'-phosphopantetheinyl transferase family protein n=1 Tax=Kitasatospora sp. NBC_01560 TaxID=2975965 RepID=UPI00386DCAA3